MLNPFGGGMGSPTPLSNQMTMMNRASSPVTGYGQGIDAMPQCGVCACACVCVWCSNEYRLCVGIDLINRCFLCLLAQDLRRWACILSAVRDIWVVESDLAA